MFVYIIVHDVDEQYKESNLYYDENQVDVDGEI